MYMHFEDLNYIATSNKKAFELICEYYLGQYSERSFVTMGKREWIGPKRYKDKKAVLRNFAQEWQYNFANFDYDYLSLAHWSDFFEEMGKKYGLLREFKENCII